MSENIQETKPNKKRIVHLKKSNGTATVYDWTRSLFVSMAVVLIVLTFFLRLVSVSGTSMLNTLKSGDKVIVTNFLYEPQYGDIIVISHGENYDQPIIKRVIATEGQTLSIDFDTEKITVDGMVLNENYTIGRTVKRDFEIPEVIPEGKVFVLGDNRTVSLDSRSSEIGLIDEKDIIGKAQCVVFPFQDIKLLD